MLHAIVLAASLQQVSVPSNLKVGGCLQWTQTSAGQQCAELDANYVDPMIHAQCVDALHAEQAASRKRASVGFLRALLTLDPVGLVATALVTAQHGQDLKTAANCR